MPDRPNVLLIVADERRPDILPCYGGQVCRTLALDDLAGSGVVFDRAYTPLAVCSPARASLLTGQYPQHHGVVSNDNRLLNGTLQDSPSLHSRRLKRLGYERWYGGKRHLGGKDNLPLRLGLPGQQFPGHGLTALERGTARSVQPGEHVEASLLAVLYDHAQERRRRGARDTGRRGDLYPAERAQRRHSSTSWRRTVCHH